MFWLGINISFHRDFFFIITLKITVNCTLSSFINCARGIQGDTDIAANTYVEPIYSMVGDIIRAEKSGM